MLQWKARFPLLLTALVMLAMFVGGSTKGGGWYHLGW